MISANGAKKEPLREGGSPLVGGEERIGIMQAVRQAGPGPKKCLEQHG
jgi:hypothetical protein